MFDFFSKEAAEFFNKESSEFVDLATLDKIKKNTRLKEANGAAIIELDNNNLKLHNFLCHLGDLKVQADGIIVDKHPSVAHDTSLGRVFDFASNKFREGFISLNGEPVEDREYDINKVCQKYTWFNDYVKTIKVATILHSDGIKKALKI